MTYQTITVRHNDYDVAFEWQIGAMDEDLKSKWIAALRDPSRGQGRKYLHQVREDQTVAECCLGVLADVAGLKCYPVFTKADGAVVWGYPGDTEVKSETGMPSLEFLNEAGIDLQVAQSLAEMNDVYEFTFAEIAAVVEAEL